MTYGPAVTWRRIPGTVYAASSEGDIRREVRGAPPYEHNGRPGHVLSQQPGGGRQRCYMRVVLSHNGVRKTWNVHVLVAMAFHGDRRAEGLTVDHVNGDTSVNRSSNLRWINGSRNSANGSNKRWRARDLEVATSERTVGDVF
jgi:hypothetical protein